MVLLAPITDARLVATTSAQSLGVNVVGKRPPLDALKRYLRDRKLLLVLGNLSGSSELPVLSSAVRFRVPPAAWSTWLSATDAGRSIGGE